jgi:hypothetical protein
MSVYQPFPLRIDSFGEQGKQYDACFQIGEFPSKFVKGSRIVILVPLKVSNNTTGIGAKFVNAFANKIPNILGQQPDRLLGYPDVPAQTGADWSISKVINLTRPHYTWTQRDGTRVVVMAEPILIAEGDMENIKRLPVTPPEDVIHEIGSNIKYKPAPPVDANGNPIPCAPRAGTLPNIPITQPPVKVPSGAGVPNGNGVTSSSSFDPNLIWQVILGVIGTIAIVIGVWMGIKLAAGPGGDMFRKLGDALGKQLAGAYKSVKDAKMPPLPTPKFPSPAAIKTPEQLADIAPTTIPEPKDFTATNPGYKSKADFINSHKTRRNPIRTPTQIADIAPTTLPEPSGDFVMTNPGYKNKDAFAAMQRRKTQRNPVKPASKIADSPAPAASTADVIDSAGPSEFVPDADELLRRRRAERNRLAQPAGTGLFDLGNAPRPIDEIAQRKPNGPGKKSIDSPTETPAQKIARLAKAHKKTPKRRNIGPIEEPDTPALARTASLASQLKRASTRAKDSLGDFDKAVQNTPKKATIFDSPATRANYGISETRSTEPQYLATAKTVPRKGGRKRRHRLKTGRQV